MNGKAYKSYKIEKLMFRDRLMNRIRYVCMNILRDMNRTNANNLNFTIIDKTYHINDFIIPADYFDEYLRSEYEKIIMNDIYNHIINISKMKHDNDAMEEYVNKITRNALIYN
jgi:hypothetical protein